MCGDEEKIQEELQLKKISMTGLKGLNRSYQPPQFGMPGWSRKALEVGSGGQGLVSGK